MLSSKPPKASLAWWLLWGPGSPRHRLSGDVCGDARRALDPLPALLQHWPVFLEVKDLLTLVPPLVGLKGNLEMTLASRLSTAVS